MEMTLEHLRKEAVEVGRKVLSLGNPHTWLSSLCAKSQFGFENAASDVSMVDDFKNNLKLAVPRQYTVWQEQTLNTRSEFTGNELVEVLDRLIQERDGKWE